MPLVISGYVDPGVYIGEVIPPGGVNVATTPLQLGVIGFGDRTKTVSNETVQRGLINGETLAVQSYTGAGAAVSTLSAPASGIQTLTLAVALPDPASRGIVGQTITITGAVNPSNNGTFTITDRSTTTAIEYRNAAGVIEASAGVLFAVSPFAQLANRSDDTIQNTTVLRNGTVLSDTFISYQPRYVQGDVTSARDFTAPNNAMALSLDGHVPVTIYFTQGGSGTITVTPVEDTQFDVSFSVPGTTAVVDVAAAINAVLTSTGAAALGYGAAYAGAAGVALTGGLRIVSPSTTPNGNVEVLPPIQDDLNLNSASRLFTTYLAPAGVLAASVVTISRLMYTATSVYTADYIDIDSTEDPLAQSLLGNAVLAITGVGTFIGASNFTQGVDYLLDAGKVDWGGLGQPPETFAVYPSAPTTPVQPYNLIGSQVSGQTGAAAQVTAVSAGIATVTGLTGMSSGSVGHLLTLTGGMSVNDGTYLIVFYDNTSSGATVHIANTTAVVDAGPYGWAEKTALNSLQLSFDGRASVGVNLLQTSPTDTPTNPLLGYAYNIQPLTPSATTFNVNASSIVANINAVVAATAAYGPGYGAVAVVRPSGSNSYVQLTTPTPGLAGSVKILVPTVGSANFVVFGLSATATPTAIGAGSEPALGSLYFVTYTIVRPTSDYNVMKRFFSIDQCRSDLGATTAQNPLMLACEIAFSNNCPSIVIVQVNDSTSPGSPSRSEFLDALAAASQQDLITDLVVLSTDLATQIDLRNNIEFESSPTQKEYRRGWFGMPVGTVPGDKDTPGSYVFESTLVLQVAPDSPGRGRYFMVTAPQLNGVTRTITLSDGSSQVVQLDSTYLAVAAAALKSSFPSPASTLARQSLSGFDVNTVTNPWLKAERATMASQGCMVVTFNAGNFTILDPVTTEVGNGGLAAFSYDSTSSQKDNVSRKITAALNNNLVGVVPTDLADFIIDIKVLIADVLNGEIGAGSIAPFRNANGTSRPIDLSTDLEVQQDPNDPSKFFFAYAYFLRYPALRMLGQFSVDNIFFSSATTAA